MTRDEACAALLQTASLEMGTKEIPGSKHNPRIQEYYKAANGSVHGDETPWCSAFINWCCVQLGMPKTGKLNARSWLKWGVRIDDPIPGCVVVLWRDKPISVLGHVALYVGPGTKKGTINLLGGNQGNTVSVRPYPADRVLGYFVPQ